MTLIRRHKVGIAVTISILIALWLLSTTLPNQCKVPFKQMPQWCVGLVYS